MRIFRRSEKRTKKRLQRGIDSLLSSFYSNELLLYRMKTEGVNSRSYTYIYFSFNGEITTNSKVCNSGSNNYFSIIKTFETLQKV